MCYWCIGFFILFSFNTAAADTLSVPELIQMAKAKSPELKAARLEAQAQQNFADQAGVWDNPNFEIEGEQKKTAAGNTNSTRYGLSQQVPMPGRLGAKSKAAASKARLAELDGDMAEVRFQHEVLRLIYEHKSASEKAVHAQERLERFKTVNTYLRSRVFAAPQKRAEASIVRAKLMILSREFRTLEAARRIAWNRLNLYLGLSMEPKISAVWFKSGENLKVEDLSARIAAASPALRRQELKIEQAESEYRFTRSDLFPAFGLNASYTDGTGAERERIYGLGVSFPLPLLNWNRGMSNGAQSLLAAERERGIWAKQRINQELTSALEQYNSARLSIQEFRIEDMDRFEKEMQSIDHGFKRGQVDLLTYIEADAEHFESLNAFLDSQIDFITARSQLYEQLGEAKLNVE